MRSTVILAVILLAGCSLVPKETTKTTAIDQAASISAANNQTIKRTVEGPIPQPNVSVVSSGTSNTVNLQMSPGSLNPSGRVQGYAPALPGTVAPGTYREELEVGATSQQGGGTTEVVRKSEAVTIPFFVKMIGLAIGIVALIFALKMAHTAVKGSAIEAAGKLADAKLKAWLNEARGKMSSTDPTVMAQASLEQAEIEGARGELKADLAKLK